MTFVCSYECLLGKDSQYSIFWVIARYDVPLEGYARKDGSTYHFKISCSPEDYNMGKPLYSVRKLSETETLGVNIQRCFCLFSEVVSQDIEKIRKRLSKIWSK